MTGHMHTPSPARGLLGKAYAPTFKLIAGAAIIGLAWLALGTENFLGVVGCVLGVGLIFAAIGRAL